MTARPPESFTFSRFASPIGEILLVTDAAARLRALDFHDYEPRFRRLLRRHYGEVVLAEARTPPTLASALRSYFDGRLDALADVEVATAGTPFQRAVWKALRDIPAGQTASYAEVAARIGRPAAVRAVAQACAANTLAVAIPCHRVVRTDGALSGYRWGVERKRALLDREAAA